MKQTEATGLHLWLVLWKASSAVRAYATRDIECLGIGLTDFAILEVLLHKGPLTVSEIGMRVMLTSGSMTTAIDRLAERGLLERRTLKADKRARIIHLTTEGRNLIERAFQEHERALNRLGEVLSERERAQAVRLLKRLGRAAQKQTEGADAI